MAPVLMSAQRGSEDGGHFLLNWGLHPDAVCLECSLRMTTKFGRV
jgi:hypothetical protein